MKPKRTSKEIVLKYYPDAREVNVGCKKGNYYNIYSGNDYLGQGKTKGNAWQAAYKNHCN